MQWIIEKLDSFFDWFGKFTGTKSKHYRIGSKVIGVNWTLVTFIALIWIAMLLLLPGGLLF
jgi:hypothetical protein